VEQEGARSGPRARCARSGHGIHQFHLQAIFFFKKNSRPSSYVHLVSVREFSSVCYAVLCYSVLPQDFCLIHCIQPCCQVQTKESAYSVTRHDGAMSR
jgi:hypothetical protein